MTAWLYADTGSGLVTLWTYTFASGEAQNLPNTVFALGDITVTNVYLTTSPFQFSSCHSVIGSITLYRLTSTG